MAKKQNAKPPQQRATIPKQQPLAENKPVVRDSGFPQWLYTFKIQAIIVAALAFVLYINTSSNEFAIDDTMVIVGNSYVLQGFKGIPKILGTDAYQSFYSQIGSADQVPGGRYRPLSIVTFAIEQQFLGAVPEDKADSVARTGMSYDMKDRYEQDFLHIMHVRHFFNVVWFMLSVVALLYFLHYIVFKNNPLIALLATVLFVIHPIHTEVVANVKSRDEIMSLLFLCLTFIFAFKYTQQKKTWLLGMGLLSYFLAFLSKEYAISMMILLPLSFYLFNNYSFGKSIKTTLPYLAVVVLYVAIRLTVTNPMQPMGEMAARNIQINPYAYASPAEKVATQISTTLDYMKLLVFPYPLSADYSYNAIPYKSFANIFVWLSLIVHIGLIWLFFYYLKRKNVLSFAIGFYLLNLLLVCNLVFNIGGTLGERLIYHSSVGFCIAVAYLLYIGMEKIKPAATGRIALSVFMVALTGLFGFKTISRNADWKNNYTLFARDIKVVPDAILANASAGSACIDKSDFEKDEQTRKDDLHKGIAMMSKAISLDTTYFRAYLTKAIGFYKLPEPDSCKIYLDKALSLYPIHPDLPGMYEKLAVYYMNKSDEDKDHNVRTADLYKGIALIKTAMLLNKKTPVTIYMNLATAYCQIPEPDSCITYLDKVRAINPHHPTLPEMYYNAGYVYYLNKKYPQAEAAWQLAVKLNPGHANAQNGLLVLRNEGAKKN